VNRDFEIVGKITAVKTIALGHSIRELPELRARFGQGRWRKRKALPMCAFLMVRYGWLKFTGMKRTELVGENEDQTAP